MAVVLTYDDLPPGSDIRREIREGAMMIVIPPYEVTVSVRREAYRATALRAAVFTATILIVGIVCISTLLRGAWVARQWDLLSLALFCVVAAMTFALVWRALALMRIQVIELLGGQSTLIDADRERLLLESDGPDGPISRRIGNSEVLEVRIVSLEHPGVVVYAVGIVIGKEKPILIASGRSHGELRWIARALAQCIGLVEP
jgi:hypothetical protein